MRRYVILLLALALAIFLIVLGVRAWDSPGSEGPTTTPKLTTRVEETPAEETTQLEPTRELPESGGTR